jgi:hypothetical protein
MSTYMDRFDFTPKLARQFFCINTLLAWHTLVVYEIVEKLFQLYFFGSGAISLVSTNQALVLL